MSKWCEKCTYEPYGSCGSYCPVFGCSFEELAAKVNEYVKILKDLQLAAESVKTYEDSVFDDGRQIAKQDTKYILNRLIELKL